MNLEWDRLKVFYYVAKERSITRAAQHLRMFQPSVTRSIQQLEHQIKAKLFIRNPRGLILTKQSEILFERVKNMMIELELATNEISGIADEVSGELTITTTYGYASTVLFKYISSFSKHHSNIRLRIVCDDTDPDLTKKEADVAVRPFIVNAQGLEQLYLEERKLQLFASKKYLEEAGVPEKTEDLDTHRLIIFETPHTVIENSQNNNFLLSLGRTLDSNRKPFMIINSAECLAQAAEDGLGIIALSNDSSLIKKHNLVRVLPQVEDAPVKMCYIYPTALKNLRIVNLLGDYLKEAYAKK
jgi:DNA-binding transcriptional LysR family regulator